MLQRISYSGELMFSALALQECMKERLRNFTHQIAIRAVPAGRLVGRVDRYLTDTHFLKSTHFNLLSQKDNFPGKIWPVVFPLQKKFTTIIFSYHATCNFSLIEQFNMAVQLFDH